MLNNIFIVVHIAFNMEGDFEVSRTDDVENGEVTWERTRRGAVIQVVGYVVYAMCLIKSYYLSGKQLHFVIMMYF